MILLKSLALAVAALSALATAIPMPKGLSTDASVEASATDRLVFCHFMASQEPLLLD
jgi:hypothetical protein